MAEDQTTFKIISVSQPINGRVHIALQAVNGDRIVSVAIESVEIKTAALTIVPGGSLRVDMTASGSMLSLSESREEN